MTEKVWRYEFYALKEVEDFLASKDYSESTRSGYQYNLRDFDQYLIRSGITSCDNLKPKQISDFFIDAKRRKGWGDKQNYTKPSTP